MATDVNPYYESGILNVLSPKKCSCQELLQSSRVALTGWLRKKCLRNKISFKIFNWPHVYVVVCDACLYYFKNEMSKKSSGAVSLYGFNRIIRSPKSHPNDPPWAFKLEHVQPNIPSLYFATPSESEMVKWMRVIKKEMLVANHKAANPSGPDPPSDEISETSASSWGSSDYNDVETSIYMEPADVDFLNPRHSIAQGYGVATADEEDEEEIDQSDEESVAANNAMAEILKSGLRQKVALKPPKQSVKRKEHYDLQQPVPEEPTTNFWDAIHFSGNRTEAAKVINDIAEDGVFLVRKSEDTSNVLVTYADGCRKYKVYSKEGGKTYLQSEGPKFDSLEELLHHYFSSALPNTNVTLTTPYSLHPKF